MGKNTRKIDVEDPALTERINRAAVTAVNSMMAAGVEKVGEQLIASMRAAIYLSDQLNIRRDDLVNIFKELMKGQKPDHFKPLVTS